MPAPAKKLKVVEGSAPAASDVTVTPVQSAADREAFIRFPYTLYAGDPNWVPPLEMERRDFLDPKKNPWFEFGNAELFLARRNGQVVGRIAAVDDPHWNDFYKTRTGFFGMFESIDDPAVARPTATTTPVTRSTLRRAGLLKKLISFFSSLFSCFVWVRS